MIKIENELVTGFDTAIRAMRNPMNSWGLSDSGFDDGEFHVGKADKELMLKLVKAGTDHSKFMRMITVSADITAPMFWWAECDTYKVGTVRNSCSKMHKIHANRISEEDFSLDVTQSIDAAWFAVKSLIYTCEELRIAYNETGNTDYWRALIEILPESYNQRATWQANYQVLRAMYYARKHHKLTEWRTFCHWVEGLPQADLITTKGGAV